MAHNEDRLARNLSPVRYIKLNGVNVEGLPVYFRCQIGITYGDISELLRTHRKSKSLEALAETLGPTKLPYWEIPEKTLLIPEGTRELWILDPQEACFLSLIRTKGDKDAPILIDKTVLSDIFELERYLQQLPEGGQSITFHGETRDLRDYKSIEKLDRGDNMSYKTCFFIDCHPKNSPIQFRQLTLEERKDMPEFIVSTYSRAIGLMKTASNTKSCSLQANHLSRSLLHLVISLWDATQQEKNMPDPNELDRCLQLDMILDHLQEIFNSPLILPTDYRKLAELFTELCGEHYGSVTVRRSFALFQKFRKWDADRYQKQLSLPQPNKIDKLEMVLDPLPLSHPFSSSNTQDVIPHRDTEGMEWQPDTPSTSTFSTASNNISHSPVQFDGIGGKVAVPISTGKELFAESPWFTSRKDSDVQDIAARMQNLDPQNAAYFRRLAISLNPASQPPQPTQEVRAADYLHAFKYYSLRCGTSPGRENVPMSGLFYWGSQLQRSCQPNVHMQWVWPDAQQREPGKLVFRAICDLRPGDHLLISSDVQGILYGRATRHQRLLDSSGRRCPCPLLTDQAISDGRREHIRNIVERVSYIRPTSDMIPDIETALNCIQEESVFHYRDTLWYALFLARDASENRNNAMLSRVLQHAIFWLKIMVGDSDTRTIDLEEHLQRICP